MAATGFALAIELAELQGAVYYHSGTQRMFIYVVGLGALLALVAPRVAVVVLAVSDLIGSGAAAWWVFMALDGGDDAYVPLILVTLALVALALTALVVRPANRPWISRPSTLQVAVEPTAATAISTTDDARRRAIHRKTTFIIAAGVLVVPVAIVMLMALTAGSGDSPGERASEGTFIVLGLLVIETVYLAPILGLLLSWRWSAAEHAGRPLRGRALWSAAFAVAGIVDLAFPTFVWTRLTSTDAGSDEVWVYLAVLLTAVCALCLPIIALAVALLWGWTPSDDGRGSRPVSLPLYITSLVTAIVTAVPGGLFALLYLFVVAMAVSEHD